MTDLVSIIMPLYNRVTLVGEAINSVMAQTYEYWELLIIDDGSTDGSYDYVKRLTEEEYRVKLLQRHREPKGAPTCRNIGLEKASGAYVIFLDSDDLLAPHCLTQRVEAFQQYPDHDFLVFPVQLFEQEVGDRQTLFFRYFHQDYLTSFLLQSHWITMSPIWKKEALLRLEGFDETLTCMQDGDLHVRALIRKMKFRVLREAKTDGYLRIGSAYPRISNRNDIHKLESKVYAHEKYYQLLIERRLLTPLRRTILAAQFLNLSWNYNLLGESEQAFDLWRSVYEREMVSRVSYLVGKSFVSVRSWPIIKNSRIIAGGVKRMYQLFLPRFLLFP